MSSTSAYGAEPDVKYSPTISYRGSFSPYGHRFESELNFIEEPIIRIILVDLIECLEGCFAPDIVQVLAGTVAKEMVCHPKSTIGGRNYISNAELNGRFKIYKRRSCSFEQLGLGKCPVEEAWRFWIHEQHRESQTLGSESILLEMKIIKSEDLFFL